MATTSSTWVLLEGLTLDDVRIGVTREERAGPRRLVIDVAVELATPADGYRDELERTVDYASLAAEVRRATLSRERRLLETLAEDLGAMLRATVGQRAFVIRVSKPDATQGATARVVLREGTLAGAAPW